MLIQVDCLPRNRRPASEDVDLESLWSLPWDLKQDQWLLCTLK
jgi:hypothetical protein